MLNVDSIKKRSRLRAFFDGVASIGEGFASIAGFGTYHAYPRRYEDIFGTDAEQLASDWEAVGNDFRDAINVIEKELQHR